jgi:hypothetical protein
MRRSAIKDGEIIDQHLYAMTDQDFQRVGHGIAAIRSKVRVS